MQGETRRISAKKKQRRRHKDKTTLPEQEKVQSQSVAAADAGSAYLRA